MDDMANVIQGTPTFFGGLGLVREGQKDFSALVVILLISNYSYDT
jgi:hypothetical protein